jgi:hypothetical protein
MSPFLALFLTVYLAPAVALGVFWISEIISRAMRKGKLK